MNEKKLIDKVVVTIRLESGYRTLSKKDFETMIGDDAVVDKNSEAGAIDRAVKKSVSDFITYIESVGTNRFETLRVEAMIANATKSAVEEEQKKHVDGGEQWKKQARITELETINARLECRIDGLIKGINPAYSPAIDNEDKNL